MKRLLLLCGPPKTGTSAIQDLLWVQRRRLAQDFGILYPDLVKSLSEPKHDFLQQELVENLNFRGLRKVLAEAAATQARTIVLSSEGLTPHSFKFRRANVREFLQLTSQWQVELVFVLREPAEWLLSKYRQHVFNPPAKRFAHPLERLYATGLPFEVWAREARSEVHNQTDPDVLRARFAFLFGPVPIHFVKYSPTVIEDVLAAIGVPGEGADVQGRRINTSPPDAYVEVLRRINRFPRCFKLGLNAAAADAISRATGSNHIQLATRRGNRVQLLVLAAALSRLDWTPNPPLDVTRESFEDARRDVAATALRTATGVGRPEVATPLRESRPVGQRFGKSVRALRGRFLTSVRGSTPGRPHPGVRSSSVQSRQWLGD